MSLSMSKLPLGVVHFMLYPETMRGDGPVVETLRTLIEDPDIQFIEITHVEDDGARREVAEMLRESGKGCAFGAQPCLLSRRLDLNDANPTKRSEAVDAMKRSVDETVEVGVRAISFLSGKDPGEQYRDEARERLHRSVRDICAHARSANPEMQVFIETFDRVPFGKNALVGPTAEAVEFARIVRRDFPDFGLLLDLSHLPLLGESPRQALTLAKDVLGHAHMGNCVLRKPDHPAYGDEHPPFGIEEGENGASELAEYLAELARIGYLNETSPRPASFEIKPLPGQTSADALANGKATLTQAWRILGWPEE